MNVMDEFRSNLLLLLHCRYPEGMLLSQLEGEYTSYFQQVILPNIKENCLSWETIFQQPEFREDFLIFHTGEQVYVKACRKMSQKEMSLIAKLARQSHFEAAKKPDFQITGCLCYQQHGQQIINSYPEPIVVITKPGSETNYIEYRHAIASTLPEIPGVNNNSETVTLATNNTNANNALMPGTTVRQLVIQCPLIS